MPKSKRSRVGEWPGSLSLQQQPPQSRLCADPLSLLPPCSPLDEDQEEGKGMEGGAHFASAAVRGGVSRGLRLGANLVLARVLAGRPSHGAPAPVPCSYPSVYLFRFFNMRTEQFKELRQEHQETSKWVCAPHGRTS